MGSRYRAFSALCLSVVSVAAVTTACSSPSSTPDNSSSSPSSSSAPAPKELRLEVVGTHPWDATSFTEGLEIEPDGRLLVGTGMTGQSRIYRTTVDGPQADSQGLPGNFFGEGVTRVGDTVWEVTWHNGTAIRRNAADLKETDRVQYPGEGWGLCNANGDVIMSNGTDVLSVRDANTFAEKRQIHVTNQGKPQPTLNELDCTGGEIYANLFPSANIARIDPASGEVTGMIDASTLPNNGPKDNPDAVVNGIARIPGTDRFFVTGKLWPDLYEVRVVDK